jgi:hypothetical protein
MTLHHDSRLFHRGFQVEREIVTIAKLTDAWHAIAAQRPMKRIFILLKQ